MPQDDLSGSDISKQLETGVQQSVPKVQEFHTVPKETLKETDTPDPHKYGNENLYATGQQPAAGGMITNGGELLKVLLIALNDKNLRKIAEEKSDGRLAQYIREKLPKKTVVTVDNPSGSSKDFGAIASLYLKAIETLPPFQSPGDETDKKTALRKQVAGNMLRMAFISRMPVVFAEVCHLLNEFNLLTGKNLTLLQSEKKLYALAHLNQHKDLLDNQEMAKGVYKLILQRDEKDVKNIMWLVGCRFVLSSNSGKRDNEPFKNAGIIFQNKKLIMAERFAALSKTTTQEEAAAQNIVDMIPDMKSIIEQQDEKIRVEIQSVLKGYQNLLKQDKKLDRHRNRIKGIRKRLSSASKKVSKKLTDIKNRHRLFSSSHENPYKVNSKSQNKRLSQKK